MRSNIMVAGVISSMSGWNTLHASIKDKDKLPSEEEITEYISSRGPHSRTSIHGDNLYVLVMRRESSHLREFAEEYAEAFDTVGFGHGSDTGPGNDRVTFYSVEGGTLEKELSSDCPTAYNGLRVESTR